MTSSLQPATIVLYDQEDVSDHIETFVSYLKDTTEVRHYGPIEFNFLGPDYPNFFRLAINEVPANAKVIELSNTGGFIANLAICYATTAIGHTFLFVLVRDLRGDWQPAARVLPMNWGQFIQLSKGQQYTALDC